MHIPINNDYAIGADQFSWHILKLRTLKRKGKSVQEWRPIKWYSNLENLINAFADFGLRTSEVESLADLLKEQKNLKAALCGSLHAQFKGAA